MRKSEQNKALLAGAGHGRLFRSGARPAGQILPHRPVQGGSSLCRSSQPSSRAPARPRRAWAASPHSAAARAAATPAQVTPLLCALRQPDAPLSGPAAAQRHRAPAADNRSWDRGKLRRDRKRRLLFPLCKPGNEHLTLLEKKKPFCDGKEHSSPSSDFLHHHFWRKE